VTVLICCCVQNFIKIGSIVQPPDAHNCWMFNAQLLGNGRCHGNCMMGCDHPSFIPIGPLTGELWHFQYFPTWRPSAILNYIFFIFHHVTVIVVLTCHCLPNFIKIGSRVRPPDAHKCWMFTAPLLGNGRCLGNRITASHVRFHTWA